MGLRLDQVLVGLGGQVRDEVGPVGAKGHRVHSCA